MNERPYPNGIDFVWLASDREGHLGAFITAGLGPVPAKAFLSKYVPVEDVGGLVCDMPKVSGVRLLVSVKRPDDFVDLAERGLFVYDWTDIHRTIRQAVRAYELVAVPSNPIQVNGIPSNLAALAKALMFVDVAFAHQKSLDVRAFMRCRDGEGSGVSL